MSTENRDFDLQAYLTKGVEQVVTDAIKATLKDPKESAFMLRFAAASRAASKKRLAAEKQFGLSREEMEAVLDPRLYTGRCAEQVTRFVEKVRPLLDDAPDRTAEINL